MITTYLLGAGASFSAIPVYKGLQTRMAALMGIVKNSQLARGTLDVMGTAYDVEQVRNALSDDLQWLIDESRDQTVDETAKRSSCHLRQCVKSCNG